MYTPVLPDPAQADEIAATSKTTRQRGWISLGSEKEIEMEMIIPTRDKV